MSDTTTDCYDTAARIEALRRGLRELPLPPAAMPQEYARVWRERMRLHRAIAGLIAPAPAAEGEAQEKREAREKCDKQAKQDKQEARKKQDKEQLAWDAPWTDWGGGARKTR